MEERVELLAPSSKREHALAQAMEAFSNFVLYDEREACLDILRLEKHSDEVGELQGGNEEYSIYRVSLTQNPKDAIAELLQEFHNNSHAKQRYSVLTKESLQQYMVDMCLRFSALYKELYNVMLVFSFGATEGQVRHIDHTHPNAMVCCYMSQDCPTTIVYSTTSPSSHAADEGLLFSISNCEELLDHWQQQQQDCDVPDLLRDILLQQQHTDLSHTYFSHWNSTLHHQLQNFGKLYLTTTFNNDDHEEEDSFISVFEPSIDPGTTLIASGNAIHAGPPTKGPRMFAYAIGVCDTSEMEMNGDAILNSNDKQQINDGEVQYSPALLQLDLCCLVFQWMREEYMERDVDDEHFEVKQFMINRLVEMVLDMQRKHGNETYARLLSDDRSSTREWLGRVVQVGAGHHPHDLVMNADGSYDNLQSLIQQAVVESDTIFAIPQVATNASSTKKRLQQDRRKKKKLAKKERRLKTN